MDVGLYGWSPPRYTRSCTKIHCHEGAVVFQVKFYLFLHLESAVIYLA